MDSKYQVTRWHVREGSIEVMMLLPLTIDSRQPKWYTTHPLHSRRFHAENWHELGNI